MSDLKTKFFKISVHLSKLEAKCNKVQCRSHAKAQIQQQILEFRQTPQLKKNSATFNSQVQFSRVSFTYDNQDNYYEDKYMLVIIQLVTQGVVVKIGEANINLSKILNSKKFSIPTTYPLNKCYDKAASIKLSVQFQQVTGQKANKNVLNLSSYNLKNQSLVKSPKLQTFYERNHQLTKIEDSYQKPAVQSAWIKSRYKSKIAQQQNTILHTKIQQYEEKLEKIRMNQHSQQQKLQQEVWSKDERITQLQANLKKTKAQLVKTQSQLQNTKDNLNRLENVHSQQSTDKQKFSKMFEEYRLENRTLKQQNQSLKAQVDNLQKNKEVKDKHYKAEMEKYSAKFMESQHQKNLFVLEMETRIKEEKDRLEKHYKNIIKSWETKLNDLNQTHKDKFINIQAQVEQHLAIIQNQKDTNIKLSEEVSQLSLQLQSKCLQCENLKSELGRLNIKHLQIVEQLELVPQTLTQKDNFAKKLRDEINEKKAKIDQLSNELNLASGTINEQTRKISKQRTQIQSLKQRQQYLTKIYQDQLQMKNLDAEEMKQRDQAWQNEILRLKSKLKIAEEKVNDQHQKIRQNEQTKFNLQHELDKKKQNQLRIDQERIMLENQNNHIRTQIKELQSTVKALKDENQQLNRYLAYKNSLSISQQQHEQQTAEWSNRLTEMERDLTIMIDKHRIEKQDLKMNYDNALLKIQNQKEQLSKIIRVQGLQIKDLKTQLGESKKIITTSNDSLQQFKDKLAQKQNQINKLMQVNQQMQKIIEQNQRNNDKLTTDFRESQQIRQELTNKNNTLKNKLKNLRGSLTKLLISIMDKLGSSSPNFQSMLEHEGVIQQQLDLQVLNYVNIGVKKQLQQKLENQKKIQILQEQKQKLEHSLEVIRHERQLESKNIITQVSRVQTTKFQKPYCSIKNHTELQITLEQTETMNNELTRDILDMKIKNSRLVEEIQKYKDLYEQAHNKNSIMKHDLQQAQQELATISTNIKTSRDQILKLTNENKQLQSQIKILEDKQYQKKKEKNSEKGLNDTSYIHKALGESQKKIMQLTTQLQQAIQLQKQQKDKSNLTTQKLQILQDQMKEKDIKIFSMDQIIKNLQQQIHNYDIKLKDSAKEKRQIEKKKQIELYQVKQQLQLQKVKIYNLEKELFESKKKQQQISEELKIANQNYKVLAEEKQASYQAIKASEQTKQLQRLSQIKNLENIIKENQYKIHLLQSTNNKQKKMLQETNNKLQAVQKKYNTLQMEMESVQQVRQREKNVAERMVQDLEDSLSNKNIEIEEIKFTLQAKIMNLQKQLKNVPSTAYTRRSPNFKVQRKLF